MSAASSDALSNSRPPTTSIGGPCDLRKSRRGRSIYDIFFTIRCLQMPRVFFNDLLPVGYVTLLLRLQRYSPAAPPAARSRENASPEKYSPVAAFCSQVLNYLLCRGRWVVAHERKPERKIAAGRNKPQICGALRDLIEA